MDPRKRKGNAAIVSYVLLSLAMILAVSLVSGAVGQTPVTCPCEKAFSTR